MRAPSDFTLSVAPMMDWTDPACRYLFRLMTRHTRLYTEMVPSQALWHGREARFLAGDPIEHPVAVQLGGSEIAELSHGAMLAERWGYDEVNLNVGCPSDRVQSGRFGACLMNEPYRVARLVAAMKTATTLPVTVKCRIGVDHNDRYSALCRFTEALHQAGVDGLIVHARKAWLSGLSPKENREIPPLRYEVVAALKQDFPALPIVLNGGITQLTDAREWLRSVDGVMIGREAYHNPWLLAAADAFIFGDETVVKPNRVSVARAYQAYVAERHQPGVPISRYTRHLVGLFQGLPGAKVWRRALSQAAAVKGAGPEVIDQAITAWQGVNTRHDELVTVD
ncbi:MAG: tRNA dihydrouridine(20/20a) synthase DusA [Spiribacter sp.]|nr:tRNA dihydrouridine(20/20a) synthase DusA [Spiribacter sp.]MDR9489263.1 tRNA dihydrouridine(20/20a) synthase DusA [Spiribacter sp.]